jgi:hypothetical protein
MDQKHSIALGIGLQTQVLKQCPIHRQLYYDDADPSPAFALALELVKSRIPYVNAFQNDAHQLMDLLSEAIAASPVECPECGLLHPQWQPGVGERRSNEVMSEA